MVDITRDKPIKVAVRVVVPVRDHPKVRETLQTFPFIAVQYSENGWHSKYACKNV